MGVLTIPQLIQLAAVGIPAATKLILNIIHPDGSLSAVQIVMDADMQTVKNASDLQAFLNSLPKTGA